MAYLAEEFDQAPQLNFSKINEQHSNENHLEPLEPIHFVSSSQKTIINPSEQKIEEETKWSRVDQAQRLARHDFELGLRYGFPLEGDPREQKYPPDASLPAGSPVEGRERVDLPASRNVRANETQERKTTTSPKHRKRVPKSASPQRSPQRSPTLRTRKKRQNSPTKLERKADIRATVSRIRSKQATNKVSFTTDELKSAPDTENSPEISNEIARTVQAVQNSPIEKPIISRVQRKKVISRSRPPRVDVMGRVVWGHSVAHRSAYKRFHATETAPSPQHRRRDFRALTGEARASRRSWDDGS
eukprot:155889_1